MYTVKLPLLAFGNSNLKVLPADYKALYKLQKTLQQLSFADNSTSALYDLKRSCCTIISPNNKPDYSAPGVNDSCYNLPVHGSDLLFYNATLKTAFAYCGTLAASDKTDLVLLFECRRLDHNNVYHRYIHKYIVMKLDRDNQIWLVRLMMKEIQGKSRYEPTNIATLMNMKTGKLHCFSMKPFLTFCAMRVLRLTNQGFTSKEIAGILYNSILTIDNHRSAIIDISQTTGIHEAQEYYHFMCLL